MTEYRFYRESTGQVEMVQKERWCWIAEYLDGTQLHQFDDSDTSFHQFKEIQQDKLHAFYMVCDEKPPIILHWIVGRKLIHFYTHYTLDFGTETERRFRIYNFGYEEGNHKIIISIMPDDGIVITDDHNKVKVS